MVVASLVILLVGGLWLGTTWQARGPEPDVGPQPNYLSSPPSDLPPAMVLLLRKSRLDKGVNVPLIMATLLDLARQGVLFLKVQPDPRWSGGNKMEVYIDNLDKKAKFQFENLIASTLAGCTLPHHEGTVANLLPRFKKSLEGESVTLGFFEEEPTKAQMRVRKPGLVILGTAFAAFLSILVLGGLFILELQYWGVILPVLTLGTVGALASFLVAPRMPKRTWKGAREAALWSAFGNHLQEITQQTEIARDYLGFWDFYLPFAIIFGYQTDWLNCFVGMHAPAPNWFHTQVSRGPVADSEMVPLTVDNLRKPFYGMILSIYETVDSDTQAAGGSGDILRILLELPRLIAR
jgi:hypothetical protein